MIWLYGGKYEKSSELLESNSNCGFAPKMEGEKNKKGKGKMKKKKKKRKGKETEALH